MKKSFLPTLIAVTLFGLTVFAYLGDTEVGANKLPNCAVTELSSDVSDDKKYVVSKEGTTFNVNEIKAFHAEAKDVKEADELLIYLEVAKFCDASQAREQLRETAH